MRIPGKVDPLVGGERAAVDHPHPHAWRAHVLHDQLHQPVGEQHHVALLEVRRQRSRRWWAARQGDARPPVRRSPDRRCLSSTGSGGSTPTRILGPCRSPRIADRPAQLLRLLADDADGLGVPLQLPVREVDARHVHPADDQRVHPLPRPGGGADGADDLGPAYVGSVHRCCIGNRSWLRIWRMADARTWRAQPVNVTPGRGDGQATAGPRRVVCRNRYQWSAHSSNTISPSTMVSVHRMERISAAGMAKGSRSHATRSAS